MLKSYEQQRVEARYEGRGIKDILLELLDSHRGARSTSTAVAAELGYSDQTITNWARDLGIDLNDYR